MSGVNTELRQMQLTSSEAATIADNLKGEVGRLDAAVQSLGSMNGQIKNAFWQGHNTHLELVANLCTRLHRMAEGISTSKVQYENQDADSQTAFNQINGAAAGAIDVSKLA